LVPAFSSKGFPFRTKKGRQYSDVTNAISLMGPFLDDAFLVSAYDLHHRFLDRPQRFFTKPELVFIDSGGYELSPYWDSTEPAHPSRADPAPFSIDDYRAVLHKLPTRPQYVVASYDWSQRGAEVASQITAAQQFFHEYPHCLSDFILKPPPMKTKRAAFLDIDAVIAHVGKLRAFDIIGVTEKELGKNLLERLRALAKLRGAMDREGLRSPIHIWGGLDPVLTPLYFFAGAEIFDGVSWLRYAFHEGVAVYRDSCVILRDGIETSLDHVQALTLSHNLTFLSQLTTCVGGGEAVGHESRFGLPVAVISS